MPVNADHLLRPGRKTTLELLLRVAVSVVVVAAIMGLLPLVAELAG
ncbi:MAG: hypothetical protein WCK58_11205 [Chloroflexota bacterium]